MARYRKEQGALNPTSGLGIIDNILNKFSNNAISNKAASEEFERLNANLTADDDLKFQFASDGEGNHGYLKGDGTFVPFSSKAKYIFALVYAAQPDNSAFTIFMGCDCTTGTVSAYRIQNTAYGTNIDNAYIKLHTDAWNTKYIDFKQNCIKYKSGTISDVLAGSVSENVSYVSGQPAITWVFY